MYGFCPWIGLVVLSKSFSEHICGEEHAFSSVRLRGTFLIGMALICHLLHHALWLFKSNDSLAPRKPHNHCACYLRVDVCLASNGSQKPEDFICLTILWFNRAHGKIAAPCLISCRWNGKMGHDEGSHRSKFVHDKFTSTSICRRDKRWQLENCHKSL